MARYTKKDADGRYYIESANGKLESNIKGHTYGEAIDRFAELENADVAPRAEVAREILREVRQALLNMVLSNSMGETYDIEKRFAEIEKKYTESEKDK